MPYSKVFFFLLISINLSGNTAKDSLIDYLEEISNHLEAVESKNGPITPSLLINEEEPYKVILSLETKERRGFIATDYHINLAYLNPRYIKKHNGRRQLSLLIKHRDKIFQTIKNENRGNYTNQVAIPVTEIGNANLLGDLFREALPLATELWKKDNELPNSFEGLQNYIIEAIGTVEDGDDSYEQFLEFAEADSNRFTFKKLHFSDRGTNLDANYTFNFEDIEASTVETVVKNKSVYVSLKTINKNRYIEALENEEQNYYSEIRIQMSNYDKAQLLVTALQQFIPDAQERYKLELPTFENNAAALSYLNQIIPSYTFNNLEIQQEAKADCLFEIKRENFDDKGSDSERYAVDFTDLDPNTVSIEVGTKGVWIKTKTRNRLRYVMTFKDEQQTNYVGEFVIGASNIPNAKLIRHSLAHAVETCENDFPTKDLDWMLEVINDRMNETAELGQELSLVEDDPCKLKLQIREHTRRGLEEESREFNLFDLDEAGMTLYTKGTKTFIKVPTKYKEKVINVFDEFGSMEYTNEVVFSVPDIQSGKIFISTLQDLTNECETTIIKR